MDENVGRRRWRVRPKALFWGIAVAFLACCAGGYASAHRNVIKSFERFHVFLTPSAQFYPSASQLREIIRARFDPAKVVVIVGGSSRMFGSGQSVGHVWSKRLQELLGPEYQVVNFGVGAARACEFGAVAAEILSRTYPKLIYIADVTPGQVEKEPDGWLYRYLFWDAYYKGLLTEDAGRRAALDLFAKLRAGDEDFAELRRETRLDSFFYYNDLWNAVAYEKLFTVWSTVVRDRPFTPRKRFGDIERSFPLSQRYPPERQEYGMHVVRLRIKAGCVKDAQGNWVEDPASPVWPMLQFNARNAFPERFRSRTLLLTLRESPYYISRMTPDEQKYYAVVSSLTAGKLQELGFAVADVGGDYTPLEYLDQCHLAEEGGDRLAADVAPLVRKLAKRLGYRP